MKSKMRYLAALLALITALSLASCGSLSGTSGVSSGTSAASTGEGEASSPVVDTAITAEKATGGFTMTDGEGVPCAAADNVYTVTAAGTYVLTGNLTGQILVDAGEEDEVTLELAGASITCDKDSPVKIVSAGKVELAVREDTENTITDARAAKTKDESDRGEGAVYAKCDLKIKGSGTLVITASYNNGIHTTKDLTLQKVTMKVTAKNNALKGNDSVTFKSGTVVAISTDGDGVKTENTDANKSGAVRGDVILSGGALTVYAAGDGIQAAHNFIMQNGEEGSIPAVLIYTGSYSGYTASSASTTSYKGVKAQNELTVSAGVIQIQSYDDGLHADYGTSFTAGGTGAGIITISGGTVNMSVYSPAGKTGGGRMGPGGGWGGQQTVSGADGIHADYQLNITGGTIQIDSAYEGLEANVINVSGGNTVVSANDDGVNATKGAETPQILVTGGILDVTVSPNGDTDGIDSNGTFTQTGGLVITRGPSMQMAAAIDADGSITVSGGTLIVLGYGNVRTSGNVKSYSLTLNTAGTHTVTVDGTTYTFTNASAYSRTAVYSDKTVA